MFLLFIKIRFIQFYRSVKEIGHFRILIIFLFLFIVLFAIFKLSVTDKNAYLINAISLILALILNFRRKDKIFSKINFNNYKLIFFLEYLLYNIPVVICFIIYGKWMQLLILLVGLFLIVQIDINSKQRKKDLKILKIIPDKSFEWKSGIRQYFVLLAILWITGITCSFLIVTVPVIIFVLSTLIMSFYSFCEPYQMIIAFEQKTSSFLFSKIKQQIILYSVVTVPLMIMFFIFHANLWHIVLGEYILFLSIFIYQLLMKYAFYEPNDNSSATRIFEILGVASIFLPLFVVLVWLLSIRFYFKSKEVLNIYLNDFD